MISGSFADSGDVIEDDAALQGSMQRACEWSKRVMPSTRPYPPTFAAVR
jgi:hypothetical protein